MKKSVDYREKYEEELRELQIESKSTGIKPDIRRIHLIYDLVKAEETQFKHLKNEDRCNELEKKFYPGFCEIAEISGGYAELDIDEDELCGTLIYKGNHLELLSPFFSTLRQFTSVISAADDIFIGTEGDNFVLRLKFNLYYKVRTANHSGEIENIKMKIHKLDIERLFDKPTEESGDK